MYEDWPLAFGVVRQSADQTEGPIGESPGTAGAPVSGATARKRKKKKAADTLAGGVPGGSLTIPSPTTGSVGGLSIPM